VASCSICGDRGYVVNNAGIAVLCQCRRGIDFNDFLVRKGFLPRVILHPRRRSPADDVYIRRVVESKLAAVLVRGRRAAAYFYSALYDLLKGGPDLRIVASGDIVSAMMDNEAEARRLMHARVLGVTLGFDTTRDIHEKMLANLAYARVAASLKTFYLFPFDTLRRLEGSYGTTFTDLNKDGYLEFVEIKEAQK